MFFMWRKRELFILQTFEYKRDLKVPANETQMNVGSCGNDTAQNITVPNDDPCTIAMNFVNQKGTFSVSQLEFSLDPKCFPDGQQPDTTGLFPTVFRV